MLARQARKSVLRGVAQEMIRSQKTALLRGIPLASANRAGAYDSNGSSVRRGTNR